MRRPALALALAALSLLAPTNPAQPTRELHTDRTPARVLPLPKEGDAFGFVIFGDRTGGPASGINVLEHAVRDTNLLDPDLVMTVGDLVQGYNQDQEWLAQMREFRGVMEQLQMRWFPVAGNHDVYFRGPNKPAEEHEKNYEAHFGPLWYAFQHKNCWFVVLYTDEANPETGERNFNKPSSQKMSPEQLAWLETTLARTADAQHVFVFLHHPRWLGNNYGDDWERVHKVLAAAGNVSAVFAGHIHRMRYDGERDGIEYFALATTGGHLSAHVPEAGYLHHYHVVTVRGEKLSMAAIPVGAVLDPREITGEVSRDVAVLNGSLSLTQLGDVRLGVDGSLAQTVEVEVRNPCARPIELTLALASSDRRWQFAPDHRHLELAPEQKQRLRFDTTRTAGAMDVNFAVPTWTLGCDYLGEGLRITVPERQEVLRMAPPAFDIASAAGQGPDRVLALDGRGAALRVAHRHLDLPDGPFTCEAWLHARNLDGRRGLINKTESSEFGLFVSNGQPAFMVHLDGRYATALAPEGSLKTGVWHHVAGVFDGAEVRLYVDGKLAAVAPGQGKRDVNNLPLFIGADTTGAGQPASFVDGWVDDVRISTGVRYEGDTFVPKRAWSADESTLLLLPLDEDRGPWVLDRSGRGVHPERVGGAYCAPAPKRPH